MNIYGNYVRVQSMEEEEQAKKLLRKQIHQTIDKLCDMDDFWVRGNWADGVAGRAFGWEIAIPHMNGDSDDEQRAADL